jgi:predicted lipoprotein with Yx(FWY)xxD motif/glucose/arabinose dehydrogenase
MNSYRFLFVLWAAALFGVLSLGAAWAQDSGVTVNMATVADNIPSLVDANGMTLYTFAHDEEGESACYDECAEEWPPLIVGAEGEAIAGDGVPGELGTTTREDGSLQVTYNDDPLYYYHDDAAPGDANGQGIHDVWYVANPATLMLGGNDELGEFLVGPGGMTLYDFTEDDDNESYCYEECVRAWPPLLVGEDEQPTAGPGVEGSLSVFERADGGYQVAYDGKPLYFFYEDEAPGDANGNAAKEVWYVIPSELGAVADAGEATASEESEGAEIGLQLVAEGLVAPIAFMSAPDGSGRFFVADQAGVIWVTLADGTWSETPFLDIRDRLVPFREDYDERGLLGLAFHPDFANNGRFFVYYSGPLRPEGPAGWDHTNYVAEFTVSADPNVADAASERIVWALDQPQFNHDAGQIAFGPDGYLYIPIGDGGGGNDTDEGHNPEIGNGQDLSEPHGSILRIDVDGGDPYGIPADNPFVGQDGVDDAIYAYGFRNPYRIAFDNVGTLYVSDAGQELWEEVSIVTAGGNYGWNIKEGTHCFDPDNPEESLPECPDTGPNGDTLIDPIIEHGHEVGNVIVGGVVYEGGPLTDLVGHYIFGAYSRSEENTGGVLLVATPSENGGLWTYEELNVEIEGSEGEGLEAYVLSFGEDANGEVYVLTTEAANVTGDTGKVWRLVPATGSDGEESNAAAATEEADDEAIATEDPSDEVATEEAGEAVDTEEVVATEEAAAPAATEAVSG